MSPEPGLQTIFCDESGYTGSNLLDDSQRFFVYAAVAISECDAITLMDAIRAQTQTQTQGEIKASTLLRTARGRSALANAMRTVCPQSAAFFANKRYALAGKFFEYVFEPVLAANNGFFYSINFHLFVANLLYIAIVTRDLTAEVAIGGFQRYMRSRKAEDLQAFLGLSMSDEGSPWRAMTDFAAAYSDQIADELKTLESLEGKWILELSSTALFRLLAILGERYGELDVCCDASKPIRDCAKLFEPMIGNTRKAHWKFGSFDAPVTFNLAQPIRLLDSKSHPGIQVADLVASSVSYALNGSGNRMERFEALGLSALAVCGLEADARFIDLQYKDVALNATLLAELHSRALSKQDPLDGIADFYKLNATRISSNRVVTNEGPRSRRVIGRNEPCVCGSGRKFKKCCGALR